MKKMMILVTVVCVLFGSLSVSLPTEAMAPPKVKTEEVSKKVYKASGYHLGNNKRGDDIVRLDVFVAKLKNGKFIITTTEQWMVSDLPNLTGAELAKQRAQTAFLATGIYEMPKKSGQCMWNLGEVSSTKATATIHFLDREGREMYVTQITERPDGVPDEVRSTSTEVVGDPAEWVTSYYVEGQAVTVETLRDFYTDVAK